MSEHLSNEERKNWRENAIKWRHEYEAKKAKEKLVGERIREKQAAESSLDAYEVNR